MSEELSYTEVASILNMDNKKLKKESLRFFIIHKIKELNIQKYNIVKKYGISSFEEMEEKYKGKRLSEENSFEDYFILSHIEEEIKELQRVIGNS
jgi:hypothetical protein